MIHLCEMSDDADAAVHSCAWCVETPVKGLTAFEDQGHNGHTSKAFPV